MKQTQEETSTTKSVHRITFHSHDLISCCKTIAPSQSRPDIVLSRRVLGMVHFGSAFSSRSRRKTPPKPCAPKARFLPSLYLHGKIHSRALTCGFNLSGSAKRYSTFDAPGTLLTKRMGYLVRSPTKSTPAHVSFHGMGMCMCFVAFFKFTISRDQSKSLTI